MKFIKKAAALFFCAALALSVMAITALADDEAVLLDGHDPTFTLTLTQSNTVAGEYTKRTNITGTSNDNAPDFKSGDTVQYDIMLGATLAGTDNSYTVHAIQFTLTETDANNVLGDATVVIGGKTITDSDGVYQYLAEYYNPAGASFTFNSNTTSVKIGTIKYTTAAPTKAAGAAESDSAPASATATFSLGSASAHHSNLNDPDAYSVTDTAATAMVEVHRNYTVTVTTPTFNASDNATAPYVKQSATENVNLGTGINNPVTYNIVDGGSFPATLQNQQGERSAVTYEYKGWNIETASGSWQTVSDGSALNQSGNNYVIPAGSFGDVTIVAKYDPKTYTANFTYAYPDGGAEPTAGKTATFSIDQKVVLADPTYEGFTFEGWKIVATADAAGRWTNGDTLITAFPDYYYGDVTFTAQWKIKGIYKQVNYAFAASTDSLTLFAVKTAEGSETDANGNTKTGLYKYSAGNMYKANKYIALFVADNNITAVTEENKEQWTVYATIATTNANGATNVTFTAGESVNETIDFNSGNVNGSQDEKVDVGDYGTAGAIFGAPTTYSDIGVKLRLMMDMDDADLGSALGNIYDLQAIMTKARS